jgi:uncharacterized lipoprotein YddW (UPF0748 family)
MSSRKKIDELVVRAKACGFNVLFVQVYRHDRAWFNSSFADTTPYRLVLKKERIDPLSYLLERAHQAGLEVHAWVNIFRIGKNLQTPILRRLGREALTADGEGRSLLRYPPADLPDGGYWLEPADKSVRAHLCRLIEELLRRYPALDGLQLDFIRYPYRSPTAGSLWARRKDFGYGKAAVERYQAQTGINPLTMELTRASCQAWDDWRRRQVTDTLKDIAATARKVKPSIKFSADAVAYLDRAYLAAFQDWRGWLEEGIVDFIAVMNYSTDSRLARYLTRASVASRGLRQVYIGLGAYLLLDCPEALVEQIADCRSAGANGIALFSYDAMLTAPRVFDLVRKRAFLRPAVVPAMTGK